MTCGDIGTNADAIDKVLSNILAPKFDNLLALTRTAPPEGPASWKAVGLWCVENIIDAIFYIARRELTLSLVVLLDEADVFLEERRVADMQRNALVSGG